MKTKTGKTMMTLQLRMPVDLVEWIDDFRAGMEIKVTRAAAIRFVLERGIETLETETRRH